MSRTAADELVEDYLRQLADAASDLEPDRRAELLEGITEHIDAARADGAEDEVAVRALLDRLGAPTEIAAAAGGAPPPATWGGLEVVALVLLTVGPLVMPLLGLLGLGLVVRSGRWRRAEKGIAAVLCLLPVAVVVAFYVTEGELFGLGSGNSALFGAYVGAIVLDWAAALFLGLRLRARS